jgi:hypothetical protein
MSKGPFVEHNYSNWEDFLSNVFYFADDMGFVFRGQGCSDWKLQTTLDRTLARIEIVGIELQSTYDFLLKEFVKSIRGRSSISKDVYSNTDEIWALGQHYGLATPLLDWTHSIYVALFFAFEDPTPSSTGYRTVWALNSSRHVKDVIDKYNSDKEDSLKFNFVDPISDENPRLLTQTGLFTKQPLNFDLENWVKEFLNDDAPYFIKMNIPDGERLKILKNLRLMNIHPSTLFPEIEGAAKYCNQTLELLGNKRKDQVDASRDELDKLLKQLTNKQIQPTQKERG